MSEGGNNLASIVILTENPVILEGVQNHHSFNCQVLDVLLLIRFQLIVLHLLALGLEGDGGMIGHIHPGNKTGRIVHQGLAETYSFRLFYKVDEESGPFWLHDVGRS